jgi:hypothetical protein
MYTLTIDINTEAVKMPAFNFGISVSSTIVAITTNAWQIFQHPIYVHVYFIIIYIYIYMYI